MLFILNRSLEVVDILSNKGEITNITPFFDDEFKMHLETGAETFKFSTMANTRESQFLVVGNSIAFMYNKQYKLFTIVEIEEEHSEDFVKTVYCEMAGLEMINEVIRPIEIKGASLRKFLETILADSKWSIGQVDIGLNDVFDVYIKDYSNIYKELQETVVGKYGGEIALTVEIQGGRVVAKYINVYSKRGKDDGFVFSYTTNISSINKTVNYAPLCTALIGEGNDGLTFKSVEADDKPINQDFIVNPIAYERWSKDGEHIMGHEKFETDSAHELLKMTREKLEERSQPQVKYDLKTELLGTDVEIGQTVRVVDHEFNPPIYLSARINELTVSFTEPNNNACVLGNYKEIGTNITDEMRQIASQLEGYVDGKFPIGGDKIENGAIGGGHLENGQIITGTHIYADSITADKIQADSIETKHLQADSISADKIQANSITSEHIKAGTIIGDHIQGGTITGDLIQGDTITGNHIQAGSIVAGSGIIADGAIGNAQISNLSADKISSGTMETSKVTIAGAGGNLLIRGNRLQVFEGHGNQQKERVSVGDVNNDGSVYGLRVRGTDGETILIDENGVTSEGITDGSVTNEHISGETKIDGYKLDINSVVREINGATETISGTKININGTSLNTELSKIETTQNEQGTQISNNTSSIQANENKINLKVDSQEYKSDKQELEKSIQKNTSAIEILDNSIGLKVEESISKIGIGANNHIKNSGDFKSNEFWSGGFEIVNEEIVNNGNEITNETNIAIEGGDTYIYSATIKLPNDFTMSKTNLLTYILKEVNNG